MPFVKPAPELLIPDPDRHDTLPLHGRNVPDTDYWQRRLRDGDVIAAEEETGPIPVNLVPGEPVPDTIGPVEPVPVILRRAEPVPTPPHIQPTHIEMGMGGTAFTERADVPVETTPLEKAGEHVGEATEHATEAPAGPAHEGT